MYSMEDMRFFCITRVKLRRFILTKEENRRESVYLEGEYVVCALHRLAIAEFYFICYFLI